MNWTFGYITGGNQEETISEIINSIEQQNISEDNYEIIVVGSCNLQRKNLKVIPFDENIKPKWITKKKNTIVQNAKFQNLVLSHDYVILEKDWYKNFCTFGEDWDVCMNPVFAKDGRRFRDWVTWKEQFWGTDLHIQYLDYNDRSQLKEMYVSGTYFCVKKDFMLRYPLDESLVWGQGEDVEWSKRIRNFWNYKCNPNSVVRFIKNK